MSGENTLVMPHRDNKNLLNKIRGGRRKISKNVEQVKQVYGNAEINYGVFNNRVPS